MNIYINEFDKVNCAALRALYPDAIVDDRPIQEVRAADLEGFDQCHFFAGIGGWIDAIELAGMSHIKGLWTGSCPCQPFSAAGKRKGKEDERHLWPVWHELIKQCKPSIVFGEQVESAVAHGWLDDVYQGLEAEGYAGGSAVLPACSVGAPHRRNRLWFGGIMADNTSERLERGSREKLQGTGFGSTSNRTMENSASVQCETRSEKRGILQGMPANGEERDHLNGRGEARAWSSGVWLDCADGKARLVEPSIQLLANGVPARKSLLHAAGNAIVPQVAAEFMMAFIEAVEEGV